MHKKGTGCAIHCANAPHFLQQGRICTLIPALCSQGVERNLLTNIKPYAGCDSDGSKPILLCLVFGIEALVAKDISLSDEVELLKRQLQE